MKYLLKILTIFITLSVLQSCATKKASKAVKSDFTYHPGRSILHPKYTIYHNQELTSTIIGKLYPLEFMYSQANYDLVIKAHIKIKFELREIIEGTVNKYCTDSAEYDYEILKENSDKRFFINIPIKAGFNKQYQAIIYTSDVLRDITVSETIIVDKRNKYSAQNFQVIKTVQNIPLFPPFVVGDAAFNIEYPWETDSLYISYYSSTGDAPSPPSYPEFNSFELLNPDSVWHYPYKRTMTYALNNKGVYFVQVDTSIKEGCVVLNFNDDFPKITTPETLYEPLIYITTDAEYEALGSENNLKLAIDNFWIKKTDNLERAKELIRIYYNRTYFSNYYFTTFKEGWKTDMGMIYVIYGPPNKVENKNNTEKWTYYRKEYKTPIIFTFQRKESPYSDKYYVLDRSSSDNTYWRQVVDSWRTGRLFTLE